MILEKQMTQLKDFIYIVHPGIVRSQSDGDRHYIGYSDLIRLYHLPYSCTFVEDDIGVTVVGKKAIHLYPDPSGEYDIEKVILKQSLDQL